MRQALAGASAGVPSAMPNRRWWSAGIDRCARTAWGYATAEAMGHVATPSAAAAARNVPSQTPTSISAYGPSRLSTDTIATWGASNSAKLRSQAS